MQGHARQHGQRVILLQRHHLKGVVRGPWAEQDLHPEALWAIYGDPVYCNEIFMSAEPSAAAGVIEPAGLHLKRLARESNTSRTVTGPGTLWLLLQANMRGISHEVTESWLFCSDYWDMHGHWSTLFVLIHA